VLLDVLNIVFLNIAGLGGAILRIILIAVLPDLASYIQVEEIIRDYFGGAQDRLLRLVLRVGDNGSLSCQQKEQSS
jgi:hypothetical protein